MSLLFDVNNISNFVPPVINREVNKSDLKNITKELCRSYKMGGIPEETFHEIIEHLLVFFIERSFDDKIYSKNYRLDNKLNKFHALSK